MISLLFKGKLRKKLISYAFTNPDTHFYVRGVASVIKEDPGNLSREMRKLVATGIFSTYMRGNLKFYTLNKKYPLYKELKEIIFKTEGVAGSLREIVNDNAGITCAFIYGSYAKKKEDAASDIDLIVVGDFSRDNFTRAIRSLEMKLGREINFTAYAAGEFRDERCKEGSFLNLVAKDRIIMIKGDFDA